MRGRIFYIPIFIIFIFLTLGCCKKVISQNSSNHNYLKKELSISDEDFKQIKENKAIIKELQLSIQHSLTKKKASSILDSFFKVDYPQKDLLTILEINRVFKGKNYRNVNLKDIDSSKALFFNDIKELEEFKKKFKPKVIIKTKIDSSKSN